MEYNKIYNGDSLEVLKTFPDESIDCCITSPPYWGLRDYGEAGQIGLEKTPEEYVAKMVEVFSQVKRCLKKEGTLWLNLGDSYAGSGKGPEGNANKGAEFRHLEGKTKPYKDDILKPKDLVGIPWRVAFALQADGFYLRQDIVWAKNNPMPESVKDRCTKSHEYVFLMTKSPKYYFDNEAIKEPTVTKDNTNRDRDSTRLNNTPGRTKMSGLKTNDYETRNKRDVWNINTKPFREAHFATFPETLVEPMLKAGCPEFVCNKCGKIRERIIKKIKHEQIEIYNGKATKYYDNAQAQNPSDTKRRILESMRTENKTIGYSDCGCDAGFSSGIVLDPFMGSGTTGVVAKKLGRNYIGIELSPAYIAIAEKRLAETTKQLSLI